MGGRMRDKKSPCELLSSYGRLGEIKMWCKGRDAEMRASARKSGNFTHRKEGISLPFSPL